MAKITVQNTQITVIKQNEDDYISLTDMLKAKDGEFFFSNWLRNRNTIEFLGIWERLMNPNFNCAEFEGIKNAAGPKLSLDYLKSRRDDRPCGPGRRRDACGFDRRRDACVPTNPVGRGSHPLVSEGE